MEENLRAYERLKIKYNDVLVIAEQGNIVKAKEILKYVADARKENPKHGKDHPDTSVVLSYLAMLQLEQQYGKKPEERSTLKYPHDEI